MSLYITLAVLCLLGGARLFMPARATFLDADLQVCLSCWQGLCSDDSSFNADSLCPCPCINSTLSSSVDKCGESGLVSIPNSECCSKANMDFISKFVTPFIEKIEPNVTDSNTCPDAYNQPINFAVSSYEEITSSRLNREYLYRNTPFTCSGCISSVTIYSKGQINSNVSLDIQVYRPSINITDNSTNVLQTMGQVLNVTFHPDISQPQDSGAYHTTKSVITSASQSCFEPGDVFSVYIPNLNQFDDILQEKSSNNPVYYRDPPSCQSLRENYFLDATDKRPLIVISVTTTDISTQPTITIISSTTDNSDTSSLSMTSPLTSVFLTTITTSSQLSTIPLTPTTQPTESSDSFLVGGIIVAVVCICNFVCTCLIIACIIVCVKKRFKSNPEVLNTSLSAPNIDDHDTNVNTLQDNPVYDTIAESQILQDNPSYATSTGSTTLQDNPAYARASNTVPVSTIIIPNEVIDDDYI